MPNPLQQPWIILLLAALMLSGCQSTASSRHAGSIPDPDPTRAAQLPAIEVSQGRAVYANKCAKCHKFYDPAAYDNAEWHMWMRKMSRKARLSESEEALLTKFLGLYRPARKGV